jgi:hypothetical protein
MSNARLARLYYCLLETKRIYKSEGNWSQYTLLRQERVMHVICPFLV